MKLVMQRPVPREPQRWEYLLSSRVEFGADSTRITWSRSDILEPLVTGTRCWHGSTMNTPKRISQLHRRTATRDVVDKIVERLPDGPPGQQQIASALHMSNRTLQRKLREEGTSFKDLLQDTRMQLARKYLLSPGRSVVRPRTCWDFPSPAPSHGPSSAGPASPRRLPRGAKTPPTWLPGPALRRAYRQPFELSAGFLT